ncbi:MAG: alpha/beta fold hydrolase [Clostridia bacterium]|nr:alpha/beta fold hydrolase [Clostridia bacterium]
MFGYKFTRDPSSANPHFDSLAQPYFHRGGQTGCLVLHGFTGTPANMRSVCEPLVESGYTVYAPLLTGHAQTLQAMDGATHAIWLDDAARAYDALLDAGCSRIFVCGLSMGALLGGLVASMSDAAGLVMMCAPVKLRAELNLALALSPLAPFVTIENPPVYDPMAQGYPGMPARRIADIKKLSAALRERLEHIRCPVMIMQARHDKRVKLKSVDILSAGLSNAQSVEIRWFEHSPHGIPYGPERERAAQDVLRFVNAH